MGKSATSGAHEFRHAVAGGNTWTENRGFHARRLRRERGKAAVIGAFSPWA
jgi:hypothetical protein